MVGGTQIINMGISVVRTKILALLLGPAGMGLVGLYMTTTGLIGSVAGLGINSSGVRQIAEAVGTNDDNRIARTIVTLRRVSLISGILGMGFVILLAPFLSRVTFNNNEHVLAISLMSLTLLFNDISAGQSALLQGLRKLRELAASQIFGAVFGALISILLVWRYREKGIVLYLVAISAFGMALSWWYARKVSVKKIIITWKDTWIESKTLLGLGIAFTLQALIGSGTDYLTRILIQRELGMDAVGIYTSTWTLSSYYVGFVLMAMGADFLPRLTASANDNTALNRLVNEQAEIGILIALPGILLTLAVAPWIMEFFYSSAFLSGAEVARWQILGVFVRVVCWPLGYVIIAKGKSALFTVIATAYGIINISLIYICLKVWKLDGMGISFALSYIFYAIMIHITIHQLTGFAWIKNCLNILKLSLAILLITFLFVKYLPNQWGVYTGLLITATTGLACIHKIKKMLNFSLIDSFRRKRG